jgi:hypothetical protein
MAGKDGGALGGGTIEALEAAHAIDLPSRHLAELLQVLDGLEARLGGGVERLAGALDPQRIAG